MAASSSSCKYDVFLSFRGEDTRKIFVGHLYRALQGKAINAFIDSEDLDKGHKILELLEAIEGSRLSIVVLSENYASSTWCLKELVKILDCMDNKNQMVVPVFYQVDPSDLRKINGNCADSFAKHKENRNLDKDEVESWRFALNRVADLSGWDSRHYKDDAQLIEEIVETSFEKLMHTSSGKANGLVGMDFHIREMMSRLCLEAKDVRVVGIWGMGGLGKTTIARAVFHEIACQFKHTCFVDNVKEAFRNKREPILQEELISRLLNEKVQSLGLNRGWDMIKERLGSRKVLVVLDDVETFLQIEALLGNPHAFGKGSRVIVTTRDQQSLRAVDATYEPMCLSDDEALELFRKYAFSRNKPNKDYDHLSRCVIGYAQGLPLALKVLGEFLDNKSVCQWEAVLEELKKSPHKDIQKVLETSYDGLDDSEKDIFLDIACHFRGWDIKRVTEILDSCGFIPRAGIKVLSDRALITVDDDVDMHDLLQDMGREFVRLESTTEPGKRSRVWSYEDGSRILTENTATDAVQCLILDLSKSKADICIHTEAFSRMRRLRLLIIYYSFNFIFHHGEDIDITNMLGPYFENMDYLTERRREILCPVDGCRQLLMGELLEFISHELRFLIWHGCPLKSLPSTFIPKNLVTLDMRGSHLQQLWEGIQPLQNLKVIMLNHCQFLVKIPDLTEATKLTRLSLGDCSSLIEVHSSVFALQNLVFLNLKRCNALKSLPGSIQMKSLQILLLYDCSNLEKFPEISLVMDELYYLELSGTAIEELPSSINNLTGLCYLYLQGCTKLKALSSNIHLSSLEKLRLNGSSKLEKFPEISGIMERLPYLDLSGTAIEELPSSINNLTGLRYLNLSGCTKLKALPSNIHPSSLGELCLRGYSKLEKFPEISGIMENLLELDLSGTAIKKLPSSINNLTGLRYLNLSGCTKPKALPSNIHPSSLRELCLRGCSKLEKFPEISRIWLLRFRLDGTAIKELPSSIDLLKGLRYISMRDCKSLEFLPDSICNLKDLIHLGLFGCSVLHYLPEKLGDLDSLQVLDIQDSGVKQLPVSILYSDKLVDGRLRCIAIGCKETKTHLSAWPSSIVGHFSVLAHLDLSDCNLLELSDGIAHISSLQTLKLCRNDLESLPSTMNRLDRLTHLDLEACRSLKSIPELSSCVRYIDAHDCDSLESVSIPKLHFRNNQFFITRTVVSTPHFQKSCPWSFQLNMSLPGSVVPDWFDHQRDGSSVSIQLLPNSLDHKVSGFGICVVLKGDIFYCRPFSVTCLCTFKGNCPEQTFSFDLLNSDRFLRSDHVLLGYVSWCLIEEGKLVNESYTEATFQISTSSTVSLRIASCGVRLAYANQDEMPHLNLPLSQVHVDYAQTVVCFLDPHELENKEKRRVETSREIESLSSYGLHLFQDDDMEVENESMTQPTIHVEEPFFTGELVIRSETEWKAESSRSVEGRGMYQTLELLRETEREGDRVVTLFDDEEISELGCHRDVMVPNSESEREEEERVEGGFGNGRRVINWKRIATVTVPLLLLAGCGIVLRQRTSGRVKGRKPT